MKKLLLIILLISAGVHAQKRDVDSLLQSSLKELQQKNIRKPKHQLSWA